MAHHAVQVGHGRLSGVGRGELEVADGEHAVLGLVGAGDKLGGAREVEEAAQELLFVLAVGLLAVGGRASPVALPSGGEQRTHHVVPIVPSRMRFVGFLGIF